MQYPFSVETVKQNTQTQTIRILIVDDQKVVRCRLQEILTSKAGLEVIGTADDGERAIELIKSLQPDVVLMDIEMPKMNGIKVMQIIARRYSQTKIIVLSIHEKEEYIQKTISAGADGYILKNTSASDLVAAIYAVYRGYSHFDSKILKKVRLVSSPIENTTRSTALKPKSTSKLANSNNQTNNRKQSDAVEQHNTDRVESVKRNDDVDSISLSTAKTEEFLPPIGKWLTWGGLFVVTAIALAIPVSSVLKYKTTVEAQATVRPKGKVHLVQAATEGEIAKILIKPGEAVNKGDAIATIDSSRLETEKTQLKTAISQQKLQLSQLNSRIKIIESQIITEAERNNSKTLAAEAELAGIRRNYSERNVEVNTQVREAQAQLDAIEATLNAAQTRSNRYQTIANEGALSKEQLAEAELEVKQQQHQLKVAKAQLERALVALEPSTSEIRIAQQRIEQIKKSGRINVARLNREKKALIQQRIEISKQLEQDGKELDRINIDLKLTNFTATATGTLSKLKLRNSGQIVQPGQEIAQIIPDDSPIEMKAAVSPQDISKLEVRQEVQMRVSACPYPDYGTLRGQVRQIAQDTSKPQSQQSETNIQAQKSAPFYEVSITPESKVFGRGKLQCSLQLGMESTANIIIREETVLQFLLRKARLISNL